MDPWMQTYIDRARRIREEAEPERLDLAHLRRVTAGDLLARSAELADLDAQKADDTDSVRGLARRLLLMPRAAWVRRRVEELGVRLEKTQRRERELFEETRDAMADEYGLGLYSQVHTWGTSARGSGDSRTWASATKRNGPRRSGTSVRARMARVGARSTASTKSTGSPISAGGGPRGARSSDARRADAPGAVLL